MSVKQNLSCPVNSHNEWDLLEEVIVGDVDGAMFPDAELINQYTFPAGEWESLKASLGCSGAVPYPEETIEAARICLENFVAILEAEGVHVRRVKKENYTKAFTSPNWETPSGFCAANPRDPFIIIGDQIIETPMADRSRYFEGWAYRELFKEYFRAGARWVSAPKPQLLDDLYRKNHQNTVYGEKPHFVVTEFEPVFDAADFVRCGRDIFGQKSQVTNQMGIDWLQRHLGDDYCVHTLQSRSPQAMHIDTTFMPLAPGKVLVNPEFLDIDKLPAILKRWEILIAPKAVQGDYEGMDVISSWANMNMLMLDEKRVIVEQKQEPMIKALKNWGFNPIPCSFENYYPFMGSFHCATLDIRRRGELKSYF